MNKFNKYPKVSETEIFIDNLNLKNLWQIDVI
jgi:hypothetical protein